MNIQNERWDHKSSQETYDEFIQRKNEEDGAIIIPLIGYRIVGNKFVRPNVKYIEYEEWVQDLKRENKYPLVSPDPR